MHRIDVSSATPDHQFTEGSPTAGVPATQVSASWMNDVQEELVSVLAAASITPVKGTQDQLLAAIRSIIGNSGHGQCRLSVVSATSLKLSPYNGNSLIINGSPKQVPAAGITISNAGLAASTLYYVYAFMSAGVMTLELSTTGHATGTTGIEQKTGDATRSLVGMVYTTASTQFADNQAQRLCINWFNRRAIYGNQGFAANRSTTSVALTEISSTERIEFLTWGEGIIAEVIANMSQNTSGIIGANAYIDSTNLAGQQINTASGELVSFTSKAPAVSAEGYHTVRLYGFAASGFTSTWSLSSTVMTLQMMG